MRAVAAALGTLLLAAVPAAAQRPDEPLPRFVVDVQGALASLPTSDGRVPSVPAGTPIPGHGIGIAAGGHVYPLRWGVVTVGAGASVIVARRAGSPFTTRAGDTTTPAVTTRVTSVNPQLSINFGHRLGWSYLSGGYGVAKVSSTSTAFDTVPAQRAPEGWDAAINYGGGARWFIKPHLGASFDVRITQLATRKATSTEPFALRTTNVSFLVGVSFQ